MNDVSVSDSICKEYLITKSEEVEAHSYHNPTICRTTSIYTAIYALGIGIAIGATLIRYTGIC